MLNQSKLTYKQKNRAKNKANKTSKRLQKIKIYKNQRFKKKIILIK